MIIKDGLIMAKPKCGTEGCDNYGFCMVGGKLVCGDCLMAFEKQKNIIITEMIKNGKK